MIHSGSLLIGVDEVFGSRDPSEGAGSQGDGGVRLAGC